VTVIIERNKVNRGILYGLDVCNLFKRDLQSLDFVANRFFMNLFKFVVTYCQVLFHFDLPSVTFKKRFENFDTTRFNG